MGLAFWVAGLFLIELMTTTPSVRQAAHEFLPWAAITPILGVACFQLDGIFIGATRTADMRNMMIISLAVFLAAWALLTPAFGNHGLWASLMIFYIARAATLGLRYPALERRMVNFEVRAAAPANEDPQITTPLPCLVAVHAIKARWFGTNRKVLRIARFIQR